MSQNKSLFSEIKESPASGNRQPDLFGTLNWEVFLFTLLIISSALAAVMGKVQQRGVLANSYFAGRLEKFKAMQTAIAQSKSGKIDELALFIGREEGEELNWKTSASILVAGSSKIVPLAGLNKGLIGLGPPESGKTYSLQKPLLRDGIRQNKPIICVDPKGDLTREIAPFARARGYEDYYLNYSGNLDLTEGASATVKGYTDSFNLLKFMKSPIDSTGAERLAKSMYANGWGAVEGKEDPFFTANAIAVLRTVLMLAKSSDKPDLITAKQILNLPDLLERLKAAVANQTIHPLIADSAKLFLSGEAAEKMVASIITTAALTFDGFTRPEFAPCLIETTIPKKFTGKKILFIQLPLDEEEVVAPVVAAMVEELIEYNFSQLTFPDGRPDQLLFFADEFHLIKFRKIPKWVAVLRSFGFAAILTFQSLAQLEKKYGITGMKEIFECCRTKVYFSPGSGKSAAEISEMLGEKEVKYVQNSWSSGGGSSSQQRQKIPLWTKEDLLRMPRGECVILNKDYAWGKRAGIPLLNVIQIPESESSLGKRYANKWNQVRKILEERTKQYTVKDLVKELIKREEIAENLLPLDEKCVTNSEKKESENELKIQEYGILQERGLDETFFDVA